MVDSPRASFFFRGTNDAPEYYGDRDRESWDWILESLLRDVYIFFTFSSSSSSSYPHHLPLVMAHDTSSQSSGLASNKSVDLSHHFSAMARRRQSNSPHQEFIKLIAGNPNLVSLAGGGGAAGIL